MRHICNTSLPRLLLSYYSVTSVIARCYLVLTIVFSLSKGMGTGVGLLQSHCSVGVGSIPSI